MLICENGIPDHPPYEDALGSCPACAKRPIRPAMPPRQPGTPDQAVKGAPLPAFAPTEYFFETVAADNRNPATPRELFDPVAGWLVVVDGPGRGRFYPIFFGRNTVGRHENATVLLTDDQSLTQEIHFLVIYDYELKKYELETCKTATRSRTLTYLDKMPRFEWHPWTGERLLQKVGEDKYEAVGEFTLGRRRLGEQETVELSDEWVWLIKVGRTTLRFVPYNEPLMRWRT